MSFYSEIFGEFTGVGRSGTFIVEVFVEISDYVGYVDSFFVMDEELLVLNEVKKSVLMLTVVHGDFRAQRWILVTLRGGFAARTEALVRDHPFELGSGFLRVLQIERLLTNRWCGHGVVDYEDCEMGRVRYSKKENLH
ncbi:hypothetical protein Tco_0876666 [Tanacetum coccineum]|uniref:Uncharacterized protein n=1 Tax=Tanacetum coccineum TaxID=301880 RepID=A0ABQ5BSZ6_9ASTR